MAPSNTATPRPPRGRDEIITAAIGAAERLFAEQSPDRVSMRAVAEQAGVTYSLLNRHIGSKRALVEAMLARSQQRWASSTEDAELDTILHRLLGDDAETGHYFRLLMWAMLNTHADELAGYRTHTSMHELVPQLQRITGEHRDARAATAALLAFISGWRAFNPFLLQVLDVEPEDADDLHQFMHRVVDVALAELSASG